MSVIRVVTDAGVKRTVVASSVAFVDELPEGGEITLINGLTFKVQESGQKVRSHIKKALASVDAVDEAA